jgi:hypothetical protein
VCVIIARAEVCVCIARAEVCVFIARAEAAEIKRNRRIKFQAEN